MGVDSPRGEVLRDHDGVRLRFVRQYQAPARDVWAALTDSDQLALWFGTWSGDPATGAVHLRMTEDDGPPQVAIIHRCDPPSLLQVDLPGPEGVWPLAVVLSESAGATTLEFTHQLAEPYDASSIGAGWQFYLDRLGAVVSGSPVPEAWDDYWPALREAYVVPADR